MKNSNGYVSQKEMLLIGTKKKVAPKYAPKRRGKKQGRSKQPRRG